MSRQSIKVNELISMTIKRYGPITSKQISAFTDLDRSTVTAALRDLTKGNDAVISIAYDAPCEITGFKAHHYQYGSYKKNKEDGREA